VLKDNPRLILVASVDEVIFAILALETIGERYLRVAGADRGLIEKIPPVPVRQIMQIEAMGRIGNRAAHHSIVVAVEEIDLLTGDVFSAVDISVTSPLICPFD
jgi:hypothetical protein